MKILAMSDIHGRIGPLRSLLTSERVDSVDKVVLLGDYVGYGNDSVAVIQHLLSLKKALGDKLLLLRGNWESMLYSAITGKSGDVVDADDAESIMFGRNNSEKSISPFLENEKYMGDFLSFYQLLDDFYVPCDGWFFAHAGLDYDLTTNDTSADALNVFGQKSDEHSLLWLGENDLKPFAKLPFHVVGGHIPFCFLHKSEAPFVDGNYINIDFRASSGYGRLGFVVFDTETGRRFYNAKPISARKYLLAKESNRRAEPPDGLVSLTPIGDGPGAISMDEAINIMLGGLRI